MEERIGMKKKEMWEGWKNNRIGAYYLINICLKSFYTYII